MITMPHKPQLKIPASYMRGGTSKGVFFNLDDLPEDAQTAGEARDKLLLRIIGSPDPYEKHIDGMGGATSSTSKIVIVSKSTKANHDVDYLFGQVSIAEPKIDWSGNCGNLTAAVAPFAVNHKLLGRKPPDNGTMEVRIWQANINKTIIANIPIKNREVQETGDFELDGVTFPAAEIQIEFLEPADSEGQLFPGGNVIDELEVPGIGQLQVTMINAGIPTIFLKAAEIGYEGTELQEDINNDAEALARFELIRAHAALKMGLIETVEEAEYRQHTPKIAFVAPPKTYQASNAKLVDKNDIDLLVRALSMGKLHHAMMGTAAVAISIAAAIPGTVVNQAVAGATHNSVCFGHPSGTLKAGAEVVYRNEQWHANKAIMSRSARVLMEGWVRVPAL